MYGNNLTGSRSNIVNWVKKNLQERKPIKVVADQWRTPTYAEDLALGVLLLIEKQATGTYHIAGRDLLTPYEMALQTAAFCTLDAALIEKVDAASFSQPAKRPPNTGLDISKARQELGFEPIGFEEGLRRMLL